MHVILRNFEPNIQKTFNQLLNACLKLLVEKRELEAKDRPYHASNFIRL